MSRQQNRLRFQQGLQGEFLSQAPCDGPVAVACSRIAGDRWDGGVALVSGGLKSGPAAAHRLLASQAGVATLAWLSPALLATGGDAPCISIWDLASAAPPPPPETHSPVPPAPPARVIARLPTGALSSVASSPFSAYHLLASGQHRGQPIQLWDLRRPGAAVGSFRTPQLSTVTDVRWQLHRSVALSNNAFLSSDTLQGVLLWDRRAADRRPTLRVSPVWAPGHSMDWNPLEPHQVACGTRSGEVALVDVRKCAAGGAAAASCLLWKSCVAKDGVRALRFSPDGVLAATSDDGSVWVAAVDPPLAGDGIVVHRFRNQAATSLCWVTHQEHPDVLLAASGSQVVSLEC